MPVPRHVTHPELCPSVVQMVYDKYVKEGAPFHTNTRPNHSTSSIQWDIVTPNTTDRTALAIARKGQTLNFFHYGIGGILALSGSNNYVATESETNLAKPQETNNCDFAIDTICVKHRCNKVGYAANLWGDADTVAVAAMVGQVMLIDPFSYRMAPEAGSPALLESAMFQALLKACSLQIEWDNGKRTEKLGLLSHFTQGGGESYLHSNGVPSPDAAVMNPEGYLWTRSGQTDSQFKARGTLEIDVVCPITYVTAPTGQATPMVPLHIWTEIVLELGGVQFSQLSNN